MKKWLTITNSCHECYLRHLLLFLDALLWRKDTLAPMAPRIALNPFALQKGGAPGFLAVNFVVELHDVRMVSFCLFTSLS